MLTVEIVHSGIMSGDSRAEIRKVDNRSGWCVFKTLPVEERFSELSRTLQQGKYSGT